MSRKLPFLALAAALSFAGFATSADEPAAAADGKVDFDTQILPLFEERCMKCHREPYEDERGRIKKPKGDFRMDLPGEMAKGGESEEDGKHSIVPGKPDESYLVKLIMLPEDDDDVMPPEGKADHLTEAEITLVKKWIEEGASEGTWKGTKFDAEGKKIE